MDPWKDQRMGRRMNQRTDGWMDGRTGGQRLLKSCFAIYPACPSFIKQQNKRRRKNLPNYLKLCRNPHEINKIQFYCKQIDGWTFDGIDIPAYRWTDLSKDKPTLANKDTYRGIDLKSAIVLTF